MTTGQPHPILGPTVIASRVTTSGPNPRRVRFIALLLAATVALVGTGHGIVMPVFARRVGEFGSGVEALGLMNMSFFLTTFLTTPFTGSLADRFGRRWLILGSFAGHVAVSLAFLFARTVETLIIVRAVEGVVTATLMPAALGAVADVSPESKRAQWVGVLMASMTIGVVFGPIIGGFLYDSFGFEAPFIASGAMGLLALMAAAALVPETRTAAIRRREAIRERRLTTKAQSTAGSLWESLPRPLYVFAILLFLDFAIKFVFAYVGPQMILYLFDDLGWTTVQYGIVVGVFGLTMVLCQTFLGGTSDKIGRLPVIVLGILLFTAMPLSLAFITSFYLLLVAAVTAGAGFALVFPTLVAAYFDITAEEHRSRIVGLKLSAGYLGGVLGPLALIGVISFTTPQGVFISAGALLALVALIALVALRGLRRGEAASVGMAWHPSDSRAMAAQLTLQGIAVRARMARLDETTW